jgi:hypothetical protein
MKILGVLFPGFTALDLIGPTTAWGLIPNTELQTVARSAGPVKVDMDLDYSHRLGRQGEHSIASAPPGATSGARHGGRPVQSCEELLYPPGPPGTDRSRPRGVWNEVVSNHGSPSQLER